MFSRTSLRGLLVATLAGSSLALAAAPSQAAVDPDDTTFAPVAGDLIGVGSDTSQHALKLLADDYNSGRTAGRLATFAATGGGDITLPGGSIARPNGSGAGKALLYGAGDNPDIDYARSSSGPSTTEVQAGLQSFPFALDTLKMAVSGNTRSNAPTSLTAKNIVDIYSGAVTNWSQLGGTAGVIAPKIPQAGSGTRSFFVAQLKAANNGVDVVLASSVAEVQEHDDTLVKNDPNAVVPFSEGRAGLLGSTLTLEGGFKADRALYNVVRGTDVGSAPVLAVFGEDGFVCSTEARELIEAAGFKQLATSARGGVCGSPTQTATSNFTLNQAVATTTALSASTAKANEVTLTAVVSGSTAPSGTVTFHEGSTVLAANVPLTSGQAVTTLSATPGAHTYTAEFFPAAGSQFEGSSDQATATVRDLATSTISETFPSTVKAGKKATGTVAVKLSAGTASGPVKVKEGAKTLATKTLSGGKATLTLPKLKAGKHTLKVVWAGSDSASGSSTSFTIKQLKR